jgi:S1-C subfamily serine protease
MPKPSKESRYAIVLLLVSAAILVGGTMIRKYAAAPKLPPPQPPDLERLQRLTAERRLRDLSDYLADAAATHARRLRSPAGLVWNDNTVLAPPAPDSPLPFDVRHVEASTGLPAPPTLRLKPGDWLLAVVRDRAGQLIFAHGIFQAQTRQDCGGFSYTALESDIALTPALIGGGLFTLDGALAGFVGGCEGRPIPIAAATVDEVIAHPRSEADTLEQRYGLRLAADPPGLVVSVWADSPAAAAGIDPGDVLDPAELSAPQFTVHRRGRAIRLSWPEPAPVRGLSLQRSAPIVRAVDSDTPAARAGLQPGDRLIRVGAASVSDAAWAAQAIDRAKGPIVLTVERRGRRMETLLQP